MTAHPAWCTRKHIDADDDDADCDAELGKVDIGEERESFLVTLYHDPADDLPTEVWLAHQKGDKLPVVSMDGDAARALGELLIRAADLATQP